jgi:amino acid adenylation domain-containing protein
MSHDTKPATLSLEEKRRLLVQRLQGGGQGQDRFPLSFAQQRLWVVHQMDPESAAYNMPYALRLRGTLDTEVLERALAALAKRHATLRTVFPAEGGGPVQRILPAGPVALREVDLRALAPGARDAEAARLARDEAARPFDLAAGPLMRVCVLRLAADDAVVLFTLHHIVSDGWSQNVLVRDLSELYTALAEGRPPELPPLATRYAEYAVWQRGWLSGAVLDAQLRFWREHLAGAPPLLELPTDRPRTSASGDRAQRCPFVVPAETSDALRALSQREDASLFMTLLAVFQALLSRWSGQEDVVVGTPVAGRPRLEVENLIGFFVNMLAQRTNLSGDPSVRELVARVRKGVLGALAHEHVPFEKLVDELHVERSATHSPLFQVVFTLDAARPDTLRLGRLQATATVSGEPQAKFDLSLSMTDAGGPLAGSFLYRAGLFEPATIERMAEHFVRMLQRAAADPDVRLSRLDLLGTEERRLVLDAWNRSERPFPRGATLHGLFDAQVRARPDADALAWGDERLTYAELDARANRLAHHLRRQGVGPEARVGVLLERGLELIVSILATVKAGGCYVPLDPTYPAERLRLMLADAGVRALVTRGDGGAAVDADGVHVVRLDAAVDAIAAEPADAPGNGAGPESLAYIVYTSGSTGRPKGVMVEHRHVVQLVCETDYVQLAPGDRVAQASNPSFDALAFEMWGAFLNGATLVGIPRDVLLSPVALGETLREERITTLYQTTALLNQLSRERPDIFAPLREVLFGGQASDPASVRRLLASGKPQRLLHMYGPTETTAWCSYETVEHVAEDALTVSVGRPTGNQRIYILGSDLEPAPIGIPGEAYVGGDGVVRGYLDRPALTAERFVPDPFSTVPGARMYRTGDRLRWKADGTLEFMGRLDAQVKIRGFRIEPGEIEAILSGHEDIEEARVIVREDEPGEPRLVAYVVGRVDAAGLREHLGQRVPEYMVPAAFVAVERLPLTPSGKLDVRALPAPAYAGADAYEAPRTPVEEVLAGIWAKLLRSERVGVHDNFFEVGGHSLLATSVVSRIREVFSVELPLRGFFASPTVAGLAELVEALRRADLPQMAPIVSVDRSEPLPLSFAQERLWFLQRLQPESSTYNMFAVLRLRGELDAAALERALGEVVRRHEVLRTVFDEVEGRPVQVIAPFDGFVLPVRELLGVHGAALRDHVARVVGQPYDLATGPVFRAELLRVAEDEHVLAMGMHHVASDGWSMGVLFREMSGLYAAFHAGEDSPLAELPLQYGDYAVWQREQLAGEVLDRQLAYWKERLAGAPEVLELPLDHPRPPVPSFRGDSVPIQLPAELLERLRMLGRSEGATLFMVLLAGFQVLLSRYGGTDDVVVGTPIAGRTRREVEPLIGFFVNTLVMRTDLSGDPGFREVLRRVREGTVGAYEHQDIPFEKLVAELQPERSLSHSPLFQATFSMDVPGGAPEDGLPGLQVENANAGQALVKFDLSLGLAATPAGLVGDLTYSTDLFRRGTMERMILHLARVLEQVTADADAPLSALELMGPAERAQVVEEWNRGDGTPLDPRSVPALFEAQAAETPDAVALAGGADTLTYAALNARANRLAHHLAARGVGPEVRVGVCLERGTEMIVALLAVLKAGGAYVPLDPGYPAERLALLVADSGVQVLLTRESLRAALPGSGMPLVSLDGDAAAIAQESPQNLPGVLRPDSLAYVIYTSGSTGTPKGVAVEHRSIVRLVRGTDYVRLTPQDRVAQASSASFDAATFEIWGALLNGATLVEIPRDVALSPRDLARAIGAHGITAVFMTTALFNGIARELPEAFSPLRYLLFGGEAVDPGAVRLVLEAGGPDHLLHVYGPTENTTYSSWHEVGEIEPDAHTVPIGRAIAYSSLLVLDEALRPVPVGIPGELYVGGEGLARGYLGRAAMTADRFIPNAFAAEPGARMYRTGDRVRWLPEGAIEFLGRTDEQVKIRGFRIELAEIESILCTCEGVREARVFVRQDGAGEKRLVAYVVGDADTDVLRPYVRERLPEYMVPAAFVEMDALPLNANGKVDRRALPAPEYDTARYVPPRTDVEEVLAAAWAEALGVERVGVRDNFFDRGGHSLLIMKLVAKVQAAFGVDLPIRTVFAMPTLEDMATEIERLIYEDLLAMDESEAEVLHGAYAAEGD